MKRYITLLILLAIVSSCSDFSGNADYNDDSLYNSLAAEGGDDMEVDEADKMSQQKWVTKSGDAQNTIIKQPDKIIKTGHLGMAVRDYTKTLEKIRSMVTQSGGYIAGENQQRNNYRITNTLIIRVVHEQFDQLITELAGEADRLTHKNIDLLDVTEDYTDLSSRLKTKKEVEQRYLEILKTAKTVKDILAVEAELREVREEIEVVEGRLKYLNDQVSYSTITLNMSQEFDYVAPPANQPGFGTRILNALIGGWNGLQQFVVGLVYLWPFAIITITLLFFIRRWWKLRKARS